MVHVVMLTCAYYDDSSLKRPNSTKENRWYEEGGQTAQVLTLELDRTSPSMLIPAEKRCLILPPRCKRAEPLEPHHQRYHRLALRSRDSVRERPRRPRLCANDEDNLPFFRLPDLEFERACHNAVGALGFRHIRSPHRFTKPHHVRRPRGVASHVCRGHYQRALVVSGSSMSCSLHRHSSSDRLSMSPAI